MGTRQRIAVGIVVTLGVAAVLGVVAADGERSAVRIASVRLPISAGVHVADVTGGFAKEGLAAEVTVQESGHAAIESVLRGAHDFALVAETPLMHALLDGKPLVIWATVAEGRDNMRIVARGDRGIHSVRDLPGKRVGAPSQTNAEYFLYAVLRLHDLPRDTVDAVDVAPDRLLAALASGEVDAVSVWRPLADRIAGDLPGAVVMAESGVYRWTWNLVSRRGDDHAAATAGAVLRAVRRANDRLLQADPATERAVAAWIGVPGWTVRGSFGSYRYAVHLDSSLLYSLEDQAAFVRGPGTAGFDFMPALDVRPLTEIDPGVVTAGLMHAP